MPVAVMVMMIRQTTWLFAVLTLTVWMGPSIVSRAADDPPAAESPAEAPSAPLTGETALPDAPETVVIPTEPAPSSAPEPTDAELHHVVGEERLRDGDVIGAIEEFREAVRLQPASAEARMSLGLALYRMGDLDGAIGSYRALLSFEPDWVPAHLNLAIALMVKQDWADARDALQTALRLQPDHTHAQYALGMARYRLGDRPGAILAFREALSLKPDFADAHYHLGLLLQLTNQEAEAAHEFYVSALAGLPQAQYFLGNAHAAGRGVERDLAVAIHWWFLAADQDVTQAKEALSQFRQSTAGKAKRPSTDPQAVAQAFATFRREMWKAYPELTRESDDASIGAALYAQGRVEEAVPVLLREASALSEPAERLLEQLYEHGATDRLAPHDLRILEYFKVAAEEGLPGSRLVLARLYATGMGVPEDLKKAKALLKGSSKDEAKALLRDISARQPNQHNGGRSRKPSPSLNRP